MDQVRVLRVVIASPGDVKPEREIIPRVVDEVNRNIARPRGLHLEVHRWETDSHPGFHPEGPQGLIDPILRIEDCDILIGIFWRRFGTPVSDAKSGTEHEFRLAYEAWKKNHKPQIMVYFSQKSYTPKSKEETDQWGLVLQFKKDFPREGLWWDYKNKSEFEQFTRNHLTQFLSRLVPIDKPKPEPLALTPRFQLPPPPADFTGREAELRDLRAALETGCVHISGLQGQGGVGKTALALKLAAELAPNYPDAQIYLDLKGVSEKPLTAAEALSHVLRTFHPEAKLPEKEDDLCAHFNSVLHGRRVLLLMDNAKDAAQVKSLIPPEGCTLLVTSRYRFTMPGLYKKDLNTFPPEDAKKLLLEIAPRIKEEAEAIAKLCGYLALALRLAATAIAEHIDLAPAEFRHELTEEKQRLKLLGEDEGVEASITLSYNLLEVETKERWRMLSVFPDTFDIPAAAAVWEIVADTAKETLSRLVQFSMLEWNDSAARYRMHDLMRDFARGRSIENESNTCARRHAEHYLEIGRRAAVAYQEGGTSITRGLARFDLEWANVQAGQSWTAATASKDRRAAALCTDYPTVMARFLDIRLHTRERIAWCQAGLHAAQALGEREGEAGHLCNIGVAYKNIGEIRRGIQYQERALAVAREIGEPKIESLVLINLGIAHVWLGEIPRAIEYYKRALDLARDIGDRYAECGALGNLGNAYLALDDANAAAEHLQKAATVARDTGDRAHEARILASLGSAYSELNEIHSAMECLEGALRIARDIGDQRTEGGALFNASLVSSKLGDRNRAIEGAEAALKILEQIEDPWAPTVRKQLEEWRSD